MATLTKRDIQKRVSKNEKLLNLDQFEWDDDELTFSSEEDCLILDFFDLSNITFKTGSDCIFDVNYGCTFDVGLDCFLTRRDTIEMINIPNNKIIKLNNFLSHGYKIIEDKTNRFNFEFIKNYKPIDTYELRSSLLY